MTTWEPLWLIFERAGVDPRTLQPYPSAPPVAPDATAGGEEADTIVVRRATDTLQKVQAFLRRTLDE